MATFRCKRSGNTISFMLDSDIQGMRKHEGYEEVIENGKDSTEIEKSVADNPDGSKGNEAPNGENENGNEKRKENEGQVLKKRGPKPKNK